MKTDDLEIKLSDLLHFIRNIDCLAVKCVECPFNEEKYEYICNLVGRDL